MVFSTALVPLINQLMMMAARLPDPNLSQMIFRIQMTYLLEADRKDNDGGFRNYPRLAEMIRFSTQSS